MVNEEYVKEEKALHCLSVENYKTSESVKGLGNKNLIRGAEIAFILLLAEKCL